jgi:hypothetical protein
MKIQDQVKKMGADIHCHFQELSALNMQKENKHDALLEAQIIKIHKLIIAKQELLKTLKLDYNLGE